VPADGTVLETGEGITARRREFDIAQFEYENPETPDRRWMLVVTDMQTRQTEVVFGAERWEAFAQLADLWEPGMGSIEPRTRPGAAAPDDDGWVAIGELVDGVLTCRGCGSTKFHYSEAYQTTRQMLSNEGGRVTFEGDDDPEIVCEGCDLPVEHPGLSDTAWEVWFVPATGEDEE
jgi:hypothetical protein